MTPTIEDLALEMASRNDRCGYVDADRICLRPHNHIGDHDLEPIARVIPIS